MPKLTEAALEALDQLSRWRYDAKGPFLFATERQATNVIACGFAELHNGYPRITELGHRLVEAYRLGLRSKKRTA